MIHIKKEKKNTKYASHLFGHLYTSLFHDQLSLIWGVYVSGPMYAFIVILDYLAKSK